MTKQNLVLNIGNTTLSFAIFEQDLLIDSFCLSARPLSGQKFQEILKNRKIQYALIGSDNTLSEKIAKDVLTRLKIPFSMIQHDLLSVRLDVEKPEEVGNDRIANVYGALYCHPSTDSIVIDMGTAVTFDVIAKEGRFLGGAIFPGVYLSAKSLADYTDKLPFVAVAKPKSCLSRSTEGNIQSGIYYGLIGTVEKILNEIKSVRFSSTKVTVIATGGLAGENNEADPSLAEDFWTDLEKDLKECVDYFEPDLTFIGLNQILKEQVLKK